MDMFICSNRDQIMDMNKETSVYITMVLGVITMTMMDTSIGINKVGIMNMSKETSVYITMVLRGITMMMTDTFITEPRRMMESLKIKVLRLRRGS